MNKTNTSHDDTTADVEDYNVYNNPQFTDAYRAKVEELVRKARYRDILEVKEFDRWCTTLYCRFSEYIAGVSYGEFSYQIRTKIVEDRFDKYLSIIERSMKGQEAASNALIDLLLEDVETEGWIINE